MSRARVAAVLVFVVSLIVGALIFTDSVPLLRGPAPESGVWHWPYLLRPVARWWPTILCAIALTAVGTWWVAFRSAKRWPVVVIALLTLGLQLSIVYAERPNVGAELVDRTLSKDTSGYAAVAGEIDDLGVALRQYPALLATFDNEHARTHPPGLVAAFWLADRAFRQWPQLADMMAAPVTLWRCTDLWVLSRPPATAAGLLVGSWLPVISAALVPIMALLVARQLWRGPAVALAASLSATIPALIIFSPTPDQLFALLSLVSLWLLIKGMNVRKWSWLLVAGFILSLMTMLSVGNAAWAGLLIAFGVVSAWQRGWSARDWVVGFGALAVGSLSLWLVYWLGWGVSPWAMVGASLDQHYQLVTSQRDYWTWLGYNPLDFLLFTGLGIIVGWGGLVVVSLVRPNWRHSDAGLLALLLGAMLVLLNVSGGTRGEVGRLWLVFMPIAAVLAGGGWLAAMGARPAKPGSTRRFHPPWPDVALILAGQLIMVLVIGMAWRPLQAVILPVTRPEMVPLASEILLLDTHFATLDGGSEINLTGHSSLAIPRTAEALAFQLIWEGEGPTLKPYTVFTQVLDGQGNLIAQQDNWPVNDAWPTTCWRPGESIVDPYEIELPDWLPAGDYALAVGLYDGPTGDRLRTVDGMDMVTIDRFTVAP